MDAWPSGCCNTVITTWQPSADFEWSFTPNSDSTPPASPLQRAKVPRLDLDDDLFDIKHAWPRGKLDHALLIEKLQKAKDELDANEDMAACTEIHGAAKSAP